MLKIIKIVLPLLILTAVGFYAYPIIKNRYFQNEEVEKKSVIIIQNENTSNEEFPPMYPDDTSSENDTPPDFETPSLEDSLSGNSASDTNSTPNSPTAANFNERGTPDSENLAHITTQHCTDHCNAFAIDFKMLEYCQQVCGIAPIKDVSNCDSTSGIEKDYCQKDLAVIKKDSSFCEKINDANIKLTCQNRIIEDRLESQPPSETTDF